MKDNTWMARMYGSLSTLEKIESLKDVMYAKNDSSISAHEACAGCDIELVEYYINNIKDDNNAIKWLLEHISEEVKAMQKDAVT